MSSQSLLSPGRGAARVQRLIEREESLSEGEQVAEDEAAFAEHDGQNVISVPDHLLPVIRRLTAAAKGA